MRFFWRDFTNAILCCPELLARPHVPLTAVFMWWIGMTEIAPSGIWTQADSLSGTGIALMNLESQIVAVNELRPDDIAQMCRLMQAHYEGVTERQFAADLNAKQWAILLHDQGHLYGFSTQVLFDHVYEGGVVKVLFSGDTVIEKSHWGSLALPVAWGRLMLSLLATHPGTDLYWLLTSKGYKTYRFLPVFFREFQPCYNGNQRPLKRNCCKASPFIALEPAMIRSAGILRAEPGNQRLREGIAELDNRRLRDPHVAFFQQLNPGHAQGDELVCLARFHPDNLNPYIRRQL